MMAQEMSVCVRGDPVRLLEADPDLARWLAPDAVVPARRASVVPVLCLSPGQWAPPPCENRRVDLGFLVLDGLLARNESLRGITCTELLGPGDLLQPWTQRPDLVLIAREVTWTALERTHLAVLGAAFAMATAPWPALRSALIERAMRRSASLSTQHALSQLSSMDERLLVLFWHLAERWGRVVPGGIAVSLSLSHTTLGQLVGGKRPTVTLALKRLVARGVLARRSDGSWVVPGTGLVEVRRQASDVA